MNDMVRSVQFCNKVDKLMTPYKMIFDRQKRQRQQHPIPMFFQTSTKEKVLMASTVVEEIVDKEEGVNSPFTEEVVSLEKAPPSKDI